MKGLKNQIFRQIVDDFNKPSNGLPVILGFPGQPLVLPMACFRGRMWH
jgi:hypothetical protein